jgi:hypothetical protein
MKNLIQKGITVKEHTEEFYRLNIRTRQRERYEEKNFKYMNDLRYEIQDELNMISVKTVEYAYQFSLKGEEKLAKKKI